MGGETVDKQVDVHDMQKLEVINAVLWHHTKACPQNMKPKSNRRLIYLSVHSLCGFHKVKQVKYSFLYCKTIDIVGLVKPAMQLIHHVSACVKAKKQWNQLQTKQK